MGHTFSLSCQIECLLLTFISASWDLEDFVAGREIERQANKQTSKNPTNPHQKNSFLLSFKTCQIWGSKSCCQMTTLLTLFFKSWGHHCVVRPVQREEGQSWNIVCPLSHCQAVGLIYFLSHALVFPLHRVTPPHPPPKKRVGEEKKKHSFRSFCCIFSPQAL